MTGLSKYKLLFHFMKPYWGRYLIIFVVSLLLAVVEFFNLAILLPLFESFTGAVASQDQPPFFLTWINEIVGLVPSTNRIVAVCFVLVIFSVMKFSLALFSQYFVSHTGARVISTLKQRIFNKYAKAKYQYFLDTKQGHLVYVALTSPDKVALALLRIPLLLNSLVLLLGILLLLSMINVYITIFLVVVSVLFGVLIAKVSRAKIYHFGRKMAQASGELNSLINELITGIKQIYIYNASAKWFERHDKVNKQYSRMYAQSNFISGLPKDFIDLILLPLVIIATAIVALQNPNEFASFIPTIGTFVMGVMRVIPNMANLGTIFMQMSGNLNDCELVNNELNKANNRDKTGDIRFASLNEAIVFDGVSFGYEGRDVLLNDLNIKFEKKHVSAIVGRSGSGKSTIINMILGLYKPIHGKIMVDGIDLTSYDAESWLAKIGFVSQDSFIFHATIAENIAFGTNYSMQDIVESAKLANAHDFIMQFPQGYDTVVGERGMKLSGGQQQRIAIARSVIRNPQIFILDEATSALDNESESLIQAAINTISKSTTTIIIAHRLTTIQNADKILILSDGQIQEEGSHDQLMAQRGFYWQLYTSGVKAID